MSSFLLFGFDDVACELCPFEKYAWCQSMCALSVVHCLRVRMVTLAVMLYIDIAVDVNDIVEV